MHFVKVIAIALFLISTTCGQFPVVNDLVCPVGSHVGFVHNAYTYIAPLHKFRHHQFVLQHRVGGVPATSTTGTDNVPGATRGGSFGGGTVNETLTMYLFHSDALIFTIHGQPLMLALPNQSPLHFDSYAETMRFESVCSGTATYIDLITYTCSSDQTTAHNFWFTLHMSVFEGLAANISALVLAGDCSQ